MSIKTRLAALEGRNDPAYLYIMRFPDALGERATLYHVAGVGALTMDEFRARFHSEPEAHDLWVIHGVAGDL